MPGDPNDKGSIQGVGSQQFVTGLTRLVYPISYGNESDASASAQTVLVTDQLSPALVDLSTFSFGPMSIGGQTLLPPQGTTYLTTVDLRPATNLLVGVDARVNTSTGLVTWKFTSIDPSTGLPTTNPTAGFLPPGANGSVLFTVMPKQNLTSGTQVQNQATIVFDQNPSMSTPVVLNTLDTAAPTSKVLQLPSAETSSTFTVQWSGSDANSGIQSYTIFASVDGGLASAWQTNTATTSAAFIGVLGHAYGFYSIATDAVGNVEPSKTSPEAITTVALPATTTALQASATTAIPGQSVTFTATVGAPAGTTVAPTGTVTFLAGGAPLGSATLNSTGVAAFASSLPVGTDSITAQYGGDPNFASSTSGAITVTVPMIATTTTVLSSGTPANLGANITLTFRVTAAAGSLIPTGTITLNDGTAALGTATLDASGTATYTNATLAAGTHPITAIYSGDGNFFGSTSNVLSQAVNAPAFSLSASPATLTIKGGQPVQTTFTVTPVGGFKSQISFTCSGLPAYATCTFAPTSVTPDGTNTPITSALTIAVNVKTGSVNSPSVRSRPSPQSETYLALTLFGMAGLFCTRRKLSRKSHLLRSVHLSCLLLSIAAGGLLACGSPNTTTPQGTDTITVTATGGGTSQTAAVTVTVQ
jgi:hypothetical protein